MSKHTPGPWIIDSIDKGPDGRDIFISAKNQGVCGGPWCLTKEDACLIAAAPELLDLVKTLVAVTVNAVDPKDFTEIRKKCRVAIAKAEGGDV